MQSTARNLCTLLCCCSCRRHSCSLIAILQHDITLITEYSQTTACVYTNMQHPLAPTAARHPEAASQERGDGDERGPAVEHLCHDALVTRRQQHSRDSPSSGGLAASRVQLVADTASATARRCTPGLLLLLSSPQLLPHRHPADSSCLQRPQQRSGGIGSDLGASQSQVHHQRSAACERHEEQDVASPAQPDVEPVLLLAVVVSQALRAKPKDRVKQGRPCYHSLNITTSYHLIFMSRNSIEIV